MKKYIKHVLKVFSFVLLLILTTKIYGTNINSIENLSLLNEPNNIGKKEIILAANGQRDGGTTSSQSGLTSFWKDALNFFNPTKEGADDSSLSGITDTVKDFVFPIATVLLASLIIIQGVRFLFSTSAGAKGEIKESLISILVAGVLILGGLELFDVFKSMINLGSDITTTTDKIFSMLIAVVQVVAFAGIIFTGFKYMTADSSDKAQLKKTLPVLFIGVFLVFAAPFIFNLLQILTETLLNI